MLFLSPLPRSKSQEGYGVYFAFMCCVPEVHPTFPALAFACTGCVDTALALAQLSFFYLDSTVYCLIHSHIVIWMLNTSLVKERKEVEGHLADLNTYYSN